MSSSESHITQNRLELARMAVARKNGKEALKYSTEILEMDSENAEAWMIKGIASAYIAKGVEVELRYKEAMSCLDRATELDPMLVEVETKRKEAKALLSNFLCILGKKTWEQAVRIANIYRRSMLGGYGRTGTLPDQAIQYYERALAIDPTNQNALKSIIHIRKETGKIELATSHIERLRQLDPTFQPPANRIQIMDGVANVRWGLYIGLSILSLLLLLVAMSKGCH